MDDESMVEACWIKFERPGRWADHEDVQANQELVAGVGLFHAGSDFTPCAALLPKAFLGGTCLHRSFPL